MTKIEEEKKKKNENFYVYSRAGDRFQLLNRLVQFNQMQNMLCDQ